MAGIGAPEFLPCCMDLVIDHRKLLHGQVEFPSKLANIGESHGVDRRASDFQELRGAERECGVRKLGTSHAAGQGARVGPHQSEHIELIGDVGQLRLFIGADVAKVEMRERLIHLLCEKCADMIP